MNRCVKGLFVFGIVMYMIPMLADANYLTLPVDITEEGMYSSLFDHDDPGSAGNELFIRYDGTVWDDGSAALGSCNSDPDIDEVNCYDGHNGVDFATSTGASVLAPYDGTVEDVWFNTCGGWQIHLWHSGIGLSTLYSHLSATTTENSVSQEDQIGEVGSTGSCTSGAHLHFGVTDGYATSTSNRIDPFGWQATSTDPWPYNQGYLWTTDPPSFGLATEVTGNITTDTTWRGNYVINNGLTINSGVTLTLEPGTVVKFKQNYVTLEVDGTLNVEGSTSSPVYFTSYKDDTVGGDTNEDEGASSPANSDWRMISISSSGSAHFDHAVVRYGGQNSSYRSNIYNDGGIVEFNNSTSSYANTYGIRNVIGTTTAMNSTFSDNQYGIYGAAGHIEVLNSFFKNNITGLYAQGLSDVTFTGNSFLDNSYAASFILTNGLTFTNGSNMASGSGENGIRVFGDVVGSQIWATDAIPYVVDGYVDVKTGTSLTLEPGAVVKFAQTFAMMNINSGELSVEGATSSPVYFTSYKDDTVGGDTNGDGGASSPANSDWRMISISSSGSAHFDHAVIRYGGQNSNYRSNIYNNGGTVTFTNSTSSNADTYGIRNITGTTTVTNSTLSDNSYGLYVAGGDASVSSSTVNGNSSYGIYNNTGSIIDAENNYWGDSSGPYHSVNNPLGSGDAVSDNVDFDPWLSSP